MSEASAHEDRPWWGEPRRHVGARDQTRDFGIALPHEGHARCGRASARHPGSAHGGNWRRTPYRIASAIRSPGDVALLTTARCAPRAREQSVQAGPARVECVITGRPFAWRSPRADAAPRRYGRVPAAPRPPPVERREGNADLPRYRSAVPGLVLARQPGIGQRIPSPMKIDEIEPSGRADEALPPPRTLRAAYGKRRPLSELGLHRQQHVGCDQLHLPAKLAQTAIWLLIACEPASRSSFGHSVSTISARRPGIVSPPRRGCRAGSCRSIEQHAPDASVRSHPAADSAKCPLLHVSRHAPPCTSTGRTDPRKWQSKDRAGST